MEEEIKKIISKDEKSPELNENKHITEIFPFSFASHLINQHINSQGGLRDESDLTNIKNSIKIDMDLLIDVLENIEGSMEQKIDFFKEANTIIDKFQTK